MKTAEKHYSPYVQELQDRGSRLIGQLTVPVEKRPEKVVQFCTQLPSTSGNFGERTAKAAGQRRDS